MRGGVDALREVVEGDVPGCGGWLDVFLGVAGEFVD